MEIKLPYGLRADELFSIDDVEGGLACNCICPACKAQLVARKGKIKIHHFAHYKSEDCGGGLETALHLMAKEVIALSGTFTTPELYLFRNRYQIKDSAEIQIENVTLETRLDDLIPDIVIETKGRKLLLEIVVTNPVSAIKRQRIKSENLPTLIFCVKPLFDELYQKGELRVLEEAFRKELIRGTKFKHWLHNAKREKVWKELKDNYAEEKKVKSFQTSGFDTYEYVEDCPLEKRLWKSGVNQGKPHAKTEEDCHPCPFGLEVNGSKVLCVGYLRNELSALVKSLI